MLIVFAISFKSLKVIELVPLAQSLTALICFQIIHHEALPGVAPQTYTWTNNIYVMIQYITVSLFGEMSYVPQTLLRALIYPTMVTMNMLNRY